MFILISVKKIDKLAIKSSYRSSLSSE